MAKHLPLLKQVLLFGIVGVITLGIDVAVTTSLYNWAHLPAYLASGIGFMSGFFFNFPMNRKKVFNHSESDRFSLHTQITMYILLSVFNLVATSALVEGFVSLDILQIQYAKVAVTAMIAAWNFLLFKFFIFSKRED